MAKDEDRIDLLQGLEKRFGIPSGSFEPYLLLEAGNSWWIVRKSPQIDFASGYRIYGAGIKAFQRISHFVKPTTRLIQLFGREASRSIVDITDVELRSLMKGEGIASTLDAENGYVILRLNTCYVLGLGLLIRGVVRSQVRKSFFQDIFSPASQE